MSSVVSVSGGIGVGRGYVRLQRRLLGRRQLQRWRAVFKSSLKLKWFRGVFKLGARVGKEVCSEDAIEDVFGEGVIELDGDSLSTAVERGDGVLSNTAFETRVCMVGRTHPSPTRCRARCGRVSRRFLILRALISWVGCETLKHLGVSSSVERNASASYRVSFNGLAELRS